MIWYVAHHLQLTIFSILESERIIIEGQKYLYIHFVKNMHAVVAGIRTWDFLRHVHLPYHLTHTSLVMGIEIFSF